MSGRVVCLGVIILDAIGRTCAILPEGQQSERIEEIRLTAAGTAGGSAVDLAKLGADVAVVGTVGNDDIGNYLLTLFGRYGIDTESIRRTDEAQTSSSLLAIRASGQRGAHHVVGANAKLKVDVALIAGWLEGTDHLHIGAPDSMGAFLTDGLQTVLEAARAAGVPTSLDLLSPNLVDARPTIRKVLGSVDYFMPNDAQLLHLYETDDIDAAADAALADGAGAVAVSLGENGCLIARPGSHVRVPAFDIQLVDTTGCGDAFSAGFIRGKMLGWDDAEAGRLGCTTGALVAGGLGSDAGIVDFDQTIASMNSLPVRAG